MKSLISVVIPIYQVKNYLIQCVESVINQTYKNIEIILVDDGSTDGSADICDNLAQADERIKVIHKPNGGLSSARNTGIELAKGEYIAFIDSDDWIDSRYMETLYELCEKDGCDIAQCMHWDIWIEGRENTDKITKPFVFSPKELAHAYESIELWQSILAWNKLYKKELFEDIRYPEGLLHEDEYTSYKVLWKANKIAVTYSKLYHYRRARQNSIKTANYSYKRLDAEGAYVERAKFYDSEGEHKLALLTQSRHLKWLYQQMRLIQVSNLEKKDNVIVELKKKARVIEKRLDIENIEYKKSEFHGYVFPFGVISSDKRIILYGAGDVGKQFFRQVTVTNYCDIIAWVDANSERRNQEGLPTQPINKLKELEGQYDYIVVAIENKKIAKEVIEKLSEFYEVDDSKIIYQIDFF